MKTTQELQAEINELKLKIAKLEFDRKTQPNADWEPGSAEGYIITHHSTLETFGEP